MATILAGLVVLLICIVLGLGLTIRWYIPALFLFVWAVTKDPHHALEVTGLLWLVSAVIHPRRI